jgi:AmmeMemoRadiSam system protein B
MPAVSGSFYPSQPEELLAKISIFLDAATPPSLAKKPNLLIVPHAGYDYSGQIAADAYSLLSEFREDYRQVILLGPSHRVPLRGIALSLHDYFVTPLGLIPIDVTLASALASFNFVGSREDAHQLEHSLEVQLPFLQLALSEFELLPMVIGQTTPRQVSDVLSRLWHEDTLIVVSTDLSHFLLDADAQRIDADTIAKITELDESLEGSEACGHFPLNGALHFARKRGWVISEISHCNSSVASGNKDRVVGYASFYSNQHQAA